MANMDFIVGPKPGFENFYRLVCDSVGKELFQNYPCRNKQSINFVRSKLLHLETTLNLNQAILNWQTNRWLFTAIVATTT